MKLNELIDEFAGLEPEDGLELLMELANELPPLSGQRRSAPLPTECRVQECQTPVYLWVDLVDGKAHLEADVPPQSPTVRGLVALLVLGLEGGTPEEILALKVDLLPRIGLAQALGMTRTQGVRGVLQRIQREIRRKSEAGAAEH